MKITYAKNNVRIYGAEEKVTFFNKDFLNLEFNNNVDFVFLAPPWGGIDYSTDEDYSLMKSVKPDIMKIMEKSWQVSEKIILCLPRNINVEEILGILTESAQKSGRKIDRTAVEIEKIYLNNKFKLNLVYFGNSSKVNFFFFFLKQILKKDFEIN